MKKFLNLACGDYFINSKNWINCDFAPQSKYVRQMDLQKKFTFDTSSFDLVYCSHYIEHINLNQVSDFINQCFQVLKNNGIIRLVLPDFENIAREYVKNIDSNQMQFASFNIAEMIDQCVRRVSGGSLQKWYDKSRYDEALSEYVYSRTGFKYKEKQDFKHNIIIRLRRLTLKKLILKIQSRSIFLVIRFLPDWFKKNHITEVSTGEQHLWVHDFYSVKSILEKNGFSEVKRVSAHYSQEIDFPLYPLDVNSENHARKGKESMYIEARKT